jgi:hypothetical protein
MIPTLGRSLTKSSAAFRPFIIGIDKSQYDQVGSNKVGNLVIAVLSKSRS